MPDARERHQRYLATIHVHPDFDFTSEEEAEHFLEMARKQIERLFQEKVIVDPEVRPRMPHVSKG